jgi:hypothetical protein
MTEPEIDTAIDRAVRDLMNVDGNGAFRARVTARLERPARRRSRLSLVAAAVVAAILAIVWARTSGVDAPAPSTSVVVAPRETGERIAGPGRPAEVAKTVTAPSALPAVSRSAARPDGIPRRAIGATTVEAPPGIPPLPALASISLEPIVQASIAPTAIVVASLPPIAEVQIELLEPRTERQ